MKLSDCSLCQSSYLLRVYYKITFNCCALEILFITVPMVWNHVWVWMGLRLFSTRRLSVLKLKVIQIQKEYPTFLLLLKTSLLRIPWKDLFFNFEPVVSKWTASNFYLFSPWNSVADVIMGTVEQSWAISLLDTLKDYPKLTTRTGVNPALWKKLVILGNQAIFLHTRLASSDS